MDTLATFRLWGDGSHTAAEITHRLGIVPSEAHEAGTRASPRAMHPLDGPVWLLSSAPRVESGVELGEQLDRLLTILEPVTAPLWQLINDGYEANWFCFVASHSCEHAVELDRALLRRLLALPGELWLDVCGADLDSAQ